MDVTVGGREDDIIWPSAVVCKLRRLRSSRCFCIVLRSWGWCVAMEDEERGKGERNEKSRGQREK